MTDRTKYLSNSVKNIPNKIMVPTLFTRYYSWLTNSANFYKATVGTVVKMFCIFGESEVDPHIPTSKGLYVRSMETIARGIIQTTTESGYLELQDYINYQVEALEKIFKTTKRNIKSKEIIQLLTNLFIVQDLDNDGKLNVQDLAVSLAYLDLQDGILNGKFRYEDAVNLGKDADSEVGKFKMRLELKNLRKFLYE